MKKIFFIVLVISLFMAFSVLGANHKLSCSGSEGRGCVEVDWPCDETGCWTCLYCQGVQCKCSQR